PDRKRYAAAALSARTSTPNSTWVRRSRTIGLQPEVGRQVESDRQRTASLAFRQRDIVEDDELRGALELVDEIAEVFVVALQPHANPQMAETRVFLCFLDFSTPFL